MTLSSLAFVSSILISTARVDVRVGFSDISLFIYCQYTYLHSTCQVQKNTHQ